MNAGGAGHTPSAAYGQPTRLLILAVWFGLLTGLAEVCALAIKRFVLRRTVALSWKVVWMGPLANVILFTLVGLILFLVARRWSKIVSLRVAIFVFAFLGYLSLLVMIPRLHLSALLVLAAGLAMQTARIVGAHPAQFHALAGRSLRALAIFRGRSQQHGRREGEQGGATPVVSRRQILLSTGTTIAGLAVGVHGWQELAERRALGKLPPASPEAPNVLLIVLDTVRAQSLSLYGYARPTTPELERWAKRGVMFERAVSTAPWTLPSHASMFTGCLPYEHSADWSTPLDTTHPTLAEVLGAHGYLSAGFVANLIYCNYARGLNRGFIYYEDYPTSPGQVILSSSLGRAVASNNTLRNALGYHEVLNRKTAADVNTDFLRWLSHQGRRPFFVFLNYMDAHEPYLPPGPFDVQFGHQRPRGHFWHSPVDAGRMDKWKMSAQELQVERDAYDGAIAYLDHHLGRLFAGLEKGGVLEKTLVIITSDHGEEFGEHGLFGHGVSLYLPSLHVPLLISFPSRVPAGTRVREPVSLRDLPATVLDLLKLEGRPRFPGNSLVRHWNGTSAPASLVTEPLLSEVNFAPNNPEWYPVSKGNMKSLIAQPYHYIKNGDGREELYDLEKDPFERHDLARAEEGRRTIERFRASLETMLARNRVSS